MFQPRSRTATILGSIANVTYLLSLTQNQLVYGYLTVNRRVLTPPPSTTLRLSDITLFATDYPYYLPVLDRLVTKASTPAGLY